MLRRVLSLALLSFASVAATVPGCSIHGIADGVREGGADGGTDGGEVGDAGCAADLAYDQANCGRCGRACAGPCDDGTCDVTTIALEKGAIDAIATNGQVVAWTAGRSVRSAPVDAKSATPTVIVPDIGLTGYLAIDREYAYYTTGTTSSHGVNECPIASCTDDRSLGFDLGTPEALAVDQGDVFVLETTGRRVFHCADPPVGCDKDIAKNTTADGAIALSLSNVYWSVLDTPGAIYSCPRSGCEGQTPRPFAPAVTTPRALAVDLNAVWWTSYDDGTVSSCPLAGCDGPPRVLAHGQKNPLGIASDGTRAYWVNAGGGTIVTCDAAGCADAPREIVKGLDRPQWIALDDTHVYFATAGGVIGRTLK